MSSFVDDGVVLKGHRFGEADRVVVILTKEHGKVRGVAKGSRKATSRVGARLEPLTHVRVQFHGSRELVVVGQVDLLDSPAPLSAHLERLTDGLTLLEVVDLLTHDREPVPHLYETLVAALRVLADSRPAALLGAFLFRMLANEGLGPELERCVSCGAFDALDYFDVGGGGVRCTSCRGPMILDGGLVGLARDAVGDGLRRVLAAPQSAATGQLNRLAIDLVEFHLERRLRVAATFASPGDGGS